MREKDSSSPNVNVQILDSQEKRNGNFHLYLSDGTELLLCRQVVLRHCLFVGTELTYQQIEIITAQSAEHEAERAALNLISRQNHSQKKLELKLRKKGFPKEIIYTVIQKLTSVGCLNDRDFAEAWVLSRLESRKESRASLYAGLIRQGINPEQARELTYELVSPEKERENLEAAAEKIFTPGDTKEKTMRKLLTRGFNAGDIRRFFENKYKE